MPPTIVVNVPPAAGPPWWITAIIALISALIAVVITAAVARSREHQKWIWEKRADLYQRLSDSLIREEVDIKRASAVYEEMLFELTYIASGDVFGRLVDLVEVGDQKVQKENYTKEDESELEELLSLLLMQMMFEVSRPASLMPTRSDLRKRRRIHEATKHSAKEIFK